MAADKTAIGHKPKYFTFFHHWCKFTLSYLDHWIWNTSNTRNGRKLLDKQKEHLHVLGSSMPPVQNIAFKIISATLNFNYLKTCPVAIIVQPVTDLAIRFTMTAHQNISQTCNFTIIFSDSWILNIIDNTAYFECHQMSWDLRFV